VALVVKKVAFPQASVEDFGFSLRVFIPHQCVAFILLTTGRPTVGRLEAAVLQRDNIVPPQKKKPTEDVNGFIGIVIKM
jgi:hypothetical protein